LVAVVSFSSVLLVASDGAVPQLMSKRIVVRVASMFFILAIY